MKTAGIASIPQRTDNLYLTVQSLLPQVDRLHVCLNGYDSIPKFLDTKGVSITLMDNELGDGGKFLGAIGYEGYYFGCDDDLVYPKGYIDYMIKKIDSYDGVVSLLGKLYERGDITSFRGGYKQVFRALGTVISDIFVDIVGSGACGFHTNKLKINPWLWERKNMSDIWLSKEAHEQGVPLVVVAHKNNYLKYTLGKSDWRIWAADYDDKYQTSVLNSFLR
jgi:hypothetical protein